MNNKVKLSSVQILIIELLLKNEGSYIRPNHYYYNQEVRAKDETTIKYFTKPTYEVLKRLSIIVPNDGKGGLKLNPEIDFNCLRN